MDDRPAAPKFASFKPKPRDPPASSETPTSNEATQVEKTRSVPKFSSFRQAPENSQKPSIPDETKASERSHGEDRRDHKSHAQHRSRHSKSSSHHRHRHHERHRSRSPERRKSPSPAPAKTAPREEPLFVTDKRGDSMIVRYGSNERAKVPTYRRYGAGRIMGATGRLRLIYDGPRQLFSLGGKLGDGPSAFRDRNILASASRKKIQVFKLRSTPGQDQTELNEDWYDYIPMSDSRKRKRASVGAEDVSGDDGPDYRSIQGKAKARDFVDSDLESAGSSDSENEPVVDVSDPARQKSIELSRHVKDHPEDVDAWLDLVDLQESLLRLDEHTRRERSADESKGLASMRVSLLEEALPSAPNKQGRERLLLRLMREGSRAWSSKALSRRWAEVSREDDSFALWKAHLNHRLSNFTYDDLKKVHIERLQLLRQRLADNDMSSTDTFSSVDICNELVYVFLRTTRFIHDSGYSELAVAAWQAILELSFARPRDASDSEAEDLLSSFGDFWESEVPRIGEENAKGWMHFAEAEEMADLPESKTDPAAAPPGTRDVYKAWATLETQRGKNARLPARTLDEGTEDDPFRVVMFSDLKPLMFYLPPSVLTSMKEPLLDAFLLFNQCLPTSRSPSAMIQEALSDPFIYGNLVATEDLTSSKNHDMQETGKKEPRFTQPDRHMALSPNVLFAGERWFSYFEHSPSLEVDLVSKVMTQLALNFGLDSVGEHSLAVAWKKDPVTVKKAAKALLKRYPANTRLYNTYALAEWRQGNEDVARKVLLSATSQDLSRKQPLWNTFAWLELEAGNKQKSLALCVLSTGDQIEQSRANQSLDAKDTIAPSKLLKARQILSSQRDFLLSSGDLGLASEFAQTLSLFEYLSNDTSTEPISSQQGSISAAINSIKIFTADVVSRGQALSHDLERLLQSTAHLLYLHASKGPFRPPFVRDQLHSFLKLFPSNTIFLNLLAWADTSLLLNDPVREALRALVLRDPHDRVGSRVFAILHELDAGTVHSARAAFEAALDSESCRGSVGLWRAYVRFCQQHRKELRGKAAEVFYRAVGACPWSKDVAMEAFGTLVREMDSGDLRGVYGAMVAKGLRIHVDLEDFSKEWARPSKRKD